MQLSYTMRLLCLALCGAGLLALPLQAAVWLTGPVFLRHAMEGSARRAEQSLFLLAMLGRLSPVLLVVGFWLPAYIRGEDNAAGESVSVFCVAGAACVLAWFAFTCFRGLTSWIGAELCARSCRQVAATAEGLPILLSTGKRPLLAVVGVFRSRIVLSQDLLAPERFSAEALEVAIDHEHAHHRNRDNLKLLALSLLPQASFANTRRPSIDRLWRLTAELAADEDALRGKRERSVLLADVLVTMAKEASMEASRASFALFSRGEHLRFRIERLLSLASGTLSETPSCAAAAVVDIQARTSFATIAVSAATLIALCCLCQGLGHRAAEFFLHAGLH